MIPCGEGPRRIRRRRGYRVEAKCGMEKGFFARDAEEAEDFFNEYQQDVADRFPEIILEIAVIYEDE